MPMTERDVLRMFLARRENYAVSKITPVHGRVYEVTMNGKQYRAVVLSTSFDYYRLRYHLAEVPPTLVICFTHTTVVPIAVLSLKVGNFAQPYELPEEINDVGTQRHSQLGSQVLLGMYLAGLRTAQTMVNELPTSTKNRYLRKVKTLGRRKRGKPVSSEKHDERVSS